MYLVFKSSISASSSARQSQFQSSGSSYHLNVRASLVHPNSISSSPPRGLLVLEDYSVCITWVFRDFLVVVSETQLPWDHSWSLTFNRLSFVPSCEILRDKRGSVSFGPDVNSAKHSWLLLIFSFLGISAKMAQSEIRTLHPEIERQQDVPTHLWLLKPRVSRHT